MRKLTILLIITLVSFSVSAEMTVKEKKIRKFLELTGSAKLGVQIINQLKPSLMKTSTLADATFWEEFMSEINADELVDLLIPLYDKYYSEEDLDNLIIFYNSTTGKKLISIMPALTQESMQVGQRWGFEISQRAINKIKIKEKEKK